MNARTYCREISRQVHEPMPGTADFVAVWILLEYTPVWRARAVEDNDLDARVKRWLAQQIAAFANQGKKARLVFVRQPELPAQGVRLLLASSAETRVFTLPGYLELLDLDLTASGARISRESSLLQAPHYFVCTNGQRDVCCARFGLPAYQVLRAEVGRRAWQVTHLGGHRFAPNVLVLPEGVLCGRVDEDQVPEFLAEIETGQFPLAFSRGRSFYAPEVQAAESFLRQGVSEASLIPDRVEIAEVTELGTDRYAVRLCTSEGTYRVEVRRSQEPLEILSSCVEDQLKAVRPFERVHIEKLG